MGIAKTLLHNLRGRRDRDEHNVIGIQGPPGIGKSTLGLGIALNLEPGFKVENVHYNRDEWPEILTAPKRGVFLLDEGANIAMNRTWQQSDQVKLMQILNMIRQRNHTLIWATPNLQRLDIVVREDLLTHQINCYKKGEAKVRMPKFNNDGEKSGWYTWPGILTWQNLNWHPIWNLYYREKERNYAQATTNIPQIHDPFNGKGALELPNVQPRGRTRGKVGRDPLQGQVQEP